MDKGNIYVYSGTGNCLAIAKQIAAELDLEVIKITAELAAEKISVDCDRAVIIYPTYAYGIPKTARKFVKSANWNVKYLAVLTSIGSHHGGSLAECIRLLKRKGQKTAYSNAVRSVENYVHLFGWPSEKKIELRCSQQKEKTAKVIIDIKEQKTNKRILFRPESCFVSLILRGAVLLLAKRYRAAKNCTGCGICRRVCPANAISIKDGKRKVKVCSKKCDHCQACLMLCPSKALRYGRITPKSRR